MPIINPNDAEQLDKHLRRFFELPDGERASVLREMYVGEMDFDSVQGIIPLQPSPKNVELPATGELVAAADGFNVVYVALTTEKTKRVRKAEAVQVAKRVNDMLGPDMVLLIANPGSTQLHFIYPSFETAIPTLRRMVIERDLPRRTAVQQLSNCYFEWQEKTLRQALGSAYDVEAVTERFFEAYRVVFTNVDNSVEGFGIDKDELEARHIFTQNLFNRLMFVYFISRKGWLTFDGDNEYLAAIWSSHIASGSEKSFYSERVERLFFSGLNRDQSASDYEDADEVVSLIGTVPFLNGGLFDEIEAERNRTIDIPDEAMSRIVGPTGFFERFNFTVMESTPYDVEVAVDPEMLGKVFEELVTDRHSSGAYYTPRPVVSFMCREALKGHLDDKIEGATHDEIAIFVDQRDPSGLSLDQAQQIIGALAEVRVIDPACGSGAYLLGMLQELIDLSITLFSSDLDINAETLYELKLHIIERNLYGVDVDDFAVNIAMLRLWLSLAIDFEGETPEPLPNLDFKIIVGDSLTGPNPTESGQIEIFQPQAKEIAAEITVLKSEFLEMRGDEKETVKTEIADREAKLLELQTYSAVPANAIDWRTRFAEVFISNDGFDIALANPPYVRFQLIPKSRKAILKALYPDALTGQSDLYVSFFARAVQILRDGGVHVFICSNSWLDSDFGVPLQKYLLKVAHIKAIYDSEVERQFSTAAINTVISVIQCRSEPNVDTRFISFTAPFELAERNLQQLNKSDKATDADGFQYRLVDLADNPLSNSFGAGKWGSHFLRSPSVWQTLGDQIGGNLSLLNEEFSVDSYMIMPKKADQVIVLRSDSIPANVSEYFVPFVRSPRYHDQPLINTSDFAILVATESDVSQSQNLSAFIDACEYRLDSEFNAPPQKDNWFVVKQTPGKILWQRRFGERHTVFLNPNGFLSYDFYRLVNHDMTTPEDDLRAAATLLNSFTWLGKEILGRVSLGEGALKTEGSDVQKIPILPLKLVPDAALAEAASILNRPAHPPEQEFNSPDRQKLDRLMAEAMGLGESEVDEVYQGIDRLIRRRYTKASSVTK